jgi:hypothetical protein
VKLKLVLGDELLQSSDELAAEDAAQCVNWQEEAWRGIDPSGAVGSQAAGGNDVVDMGMMLKVLSPGMEHAEEPDVGSQMLVRRFLLHVLPGGLVRIRHFGLFANRRRSAALERCRVLLGATACAEPPEPPALRCPACSGIMLVVERLTRGQIYFCAGRAASEPRRRSVDSS